MALLATLIARALLECGVWFCLINTWFVKLVATILEDSLESEHECLLIVNLVFVVDVTFFELHPSSNLFYAWQDRSSKTIEAVGKCIDNLLHYDLFQRSLL